MLGVEGWGDRWLMGVSAFLKAGCSHSAPSSGPGMEALVAYGTDCTKQWGQEEERRAKKGFWGAT